MSEPKNFILVPPEKGPFPKLPLIEPPACMKQFLELFEVYCYVGCCNWDAINLTENHLRQLVASGRASQVVTRSVIQEMRDWTERVKETSFVRDEQGGVWCIDPQEALEELTQALVILDRMIESPRT